MTDSVMEEVDPAVLQESLNLLADISEEHTAIDREIQKISQEKLRPVYEKRRSIVNRIPRFWALVIRGSDALSDYISYEDDELLDSITDLYIEWDKTDAQSFTITFQFDPENEFLTTTEVSKKFTFVTKTLPPSSSTSDNATALPAPQKVEKYISEPVQLKWKKHKNLTKSKTGQTNSFFNWFKFTGEGPGDYSGGETVALTFAEMIYPHAIKLFIDGMQNEMDNDDLEDEYDLDSDEDGEEGSEDDEENDDDESKEAPHEDMPPRKKLKTENNKDIKN